MRPLVIAAALLAACGGGGASPAADADPNQPDADPNQPDADPNRPDGAAGGPDGGGDPPALAGCFLSCAVPADCAQAGELFGADNYTCDDGICQWTGCNSTAECTTTYMSPDWTCGTTATNPFPTCYPTCASADDCAAPGELSGVDNYTCDGGKCRWTGCNSTAECTTTFMSADYACAPGEGGALPTCVATCTIAADCASPSPLLDTDNYACDGGLCRWTGCNSTTECTATFMNADYVCR